MALTRTHHDSVEHSTHAGRINAVDWIAMILLMVGGVNWGLVGLFDVNLVAALFGEMSTLSRMVYALVGLAALWCVFTVTKLRRY